MVVHPKNKLINWGVGLLDKGHITYKQKERKIAIESFCNLQVPTVLSLILLHHHSMMIYDKFIENSIY